MQASVEQCRRGSKERQLMSKPAIHTVPHGDAWANKHENASKIIKAFATREKAIEVGAIEAHREKVEHVIHKENGKVERRMPYIPDAAADTKP
jgi:hypothetical protein